MAIKEITPQQAHDVLSAGPDVAYIDVRTEREFAAGHPQGAVNIPVAFPDPARGMVMNADFVKVVEANFSQGQRRSSSVAKQDHGPTQRRDYSNRRVIKRFRICSVSAACVIRWGM